MEVPVEPVPGKKKRIGPLRRALLRGLGILMPPLLTIALFAYAWALIEKYGLVPVENTARLLYQQVHVDTLPEIPQGASDVKRNGRGEVTSFSFGEREYERSGEGNWRGYYTHDYVREQLPRRLTLPFFLAAFVLLLYFLGKFLAAGVGRMIVHAFEALIRRLPLINAVYGSVKQVTDYFFKEREEEIEFNRVIAVEYPRKGIWSLGFVTGESLLDIQAAANQPVLSIFIPNSPAPLTGFTITVLKSEVIDLNITIDEAIKFVVSGGVVVPPQQLPLSEGKQLDVAGALAPTSGNGQTGNGKSAEQPQDSLEAPE